MEYGGYYIIYAETLNSTNRTDHSKLAGNNSKDLSEMEIPKLVRMFECIGHINMEIKNISGDKNLGPDISLGTFSETMEHPNSRDISRYKRLKEAFISTLHVSRFLSAHL